MNRRLQHAVHRLAVAALLATAILASGCLTGSAGPAKLGTKVAVGAWDAPDRPLLAGALGDPRSNGLPGSGWTPPFDVTPTLHDLDGDGTDEVIAFGNDTFVHVFDADSGRVQARLPTVTPPNWYVERILNDVAAGVLVPGEKASIIVATPAAYVTRWTLTSEDGGQMRFNKTWEMRLTQCRNEPSMDSGPVLHDVDGDGRQEILLQTEENGLYALTPEGRVLWRSCQGGGNAPPVLADVDGDGADEALFATDNGQVLALDARTGATLWSFDITKHAIWPGSISVAPTVVDLDGVLPREVVFTARHAWGEDMETWKKVHLAIVAIRPGQGPGGSELVWLKTPEWGNPLSYTPLVARDVDGDGRVDLFGMDWNTIGHYPGNWENLGNATVFRLDAQGETVWNRSIDAWWSNKAIAVLDADGDGQFEVLANGPHEGTDGLWRFSAATGEAEGFVGVPGWKVLRGPVLTDVQGDGKLEVVLSMEPILSVRPRGGVFVITLPGARA